MRPRVSTDTSVVGGCEDCELRDPSRRRLEAFRRSDMTLVISELTSVGSSLEDVFFELTETEATGGPS